MKNKTLVYLFVMMLMNLSLSASHGLKRKSNQYREPTFYQLFMRTVKAKNIPDIISDERHLMGEAKALMAALKRYDLNAPAHRTTGWNDFVEAEWPFMAMVYGGLALCHLPEYSPNTKRQCRQWVKWALSALKRPAMSGFVKDHFGNPFPSKGLAPKIGVFMHGHYLYLALHAKKYLGIDDFDEDIHKIYKATLRDYRTAELLPSYASMYYSSDNGAALAAIALYDEVFRVSTSRKIRSKSVSALRKYYLDEKSQLVCTYINVKKKKPSSTPRGTGVMYLDQFLPLIDQSFAEQQWQATKRTMVISLSKISAEIDIMPAWLDTGLLSHLPDVPVCMEHPNTLPWLERQWGDTDSGPVVLGVSTSASGFLLIAAAKNNDIKMAKSALKFAHYMGDYKWQGDYYVATNTFHEVGQAVIFYGKILTLLAEKKAIN
ncbi:MAG: hypothetical protein HQL32_00795 [Planctomycetes bacterium]|nr:hypothetical protein [Planctomycetota bacterium]